MAKVDTQDLRNVVLLSHGGAGKTMLAESMLFASGVINRLGKTDDGNTTSDYEPEEQKRTTSVQTSVLPCPWKGRKINVLDTPGYADYRGEVSSAIRVAESAVIVVDATSGVEVGTLQMWWMADELELPRAVFVNKMDRENVSYESTLNALTEVFGRKCLAVQLPVGAEASFSGVVSLLGDGSGVADEMRDAYDELREKLLETIAEADDELMMKYLEGEELTDAEIAQGLKQGIGAGDIVPVLFGAAGSGIGAAEAMDLVVDAMPSPADGKPVQAEAKDGEVTLTAGEGGPLAAQVLKTSADPFVGKLSYIRVISGEFKSDQQIWNATRSEAERVGQVYVLTGKEQEAVPGLAPGDIGAVAKLSSVLTGDTLTERGTPIVLPAFTFPTPVYQMAAYPKSKADGDKITTALARITEEDPSLSVRREPDTGELLLGGLGDVHVEVAVERMQRKFGVELELRTPRVPYKETITRQTQIEYRHKKQSGGHGQFGHVYLDLEPLQRGGGFEFAEKVVGGSVPREYIPSVEKGCRQALAGGVVSGYPVVDLRATLFDGSFHSVDSSGVSFEIAGSHALSDGIKQAGPIILEPVMRVDVRIPDSDAGEVMGDLNGKRARILGMTPQGDGTTVVEAEAPQSEMLRYATDLRSQTQGRGSFTISFAHYDPVPAHITERIVREIEQRREAERS